MKDPQNAIALKHWIDTEILWKRNLDYLVSSKTVDKWFLSPVINFRPLLFIKPWVSTATDMKM
jgi:hypothetical protein